MEKEQVWDKFWLHASPDVNSLRVWFGIYPILAAGMLESSVFLCQVAGNRTEVSRSLSTKQIMSMFSRGAHVASSSAVSYFGGLISLNTIMAGQ